LRRLHPFRLIDARRYPADQLDRRPGDLVVEEGLVEVGQLLQRRTDADQFARPLWWQVKTFLGVVPRRTEAEHACKAPLVHLGEVEGEVRLADVFGLACALEVFTDRVGGEAVGQVDAREAAGGGGNSGGGGGGGRRRGGGGSGGKRL